MLRSTIEKLEHVKKADFIPIFMKSLKNHVFITSKEIVVAFMKEIDDNCSYYDPDFQKWIKKLKYKMKDLIKQSKQLGIISEHNPRVYKVIDTSLLTPDIFKRQVKGWKRDVFAFLSKHPDVTLHDLRDQFPDKNKKTLNGYRWEFEKLKMAHPELISISEMPQIRDDY